MKSKTRLDDFLIKKATNDIIKRGDVSVVNLSFYSGKTIGSEINFLPGTTWNNVFDRGSDIFWVVSSGNDGNDYDTTLFRPEPAARSRFYDNVISVAGHKTDSPTGIIRVVPGTLHGDSNYDSSNRYVQISAPGIVQAAEETNSYSNIYSDHSFGTSFAAPLVAGAAALVLATSDTNVKDLKDLLVKTGWITAAGNPHPALDILAAVRFSHCKLAPADGRCCQDNDCEGNAICKANSCLHRGNPRFELSWLGDGKTF